MSEVSSKVKDIQKLTLGNNDILVVRVDVENLSKKVAETYMENIKNSFSTLLLSRKVVVMPSTIALDIITLESLNNG